MPARPRAFGGDREKAARVGRWVAASLLEDHKQRSWCNANDLAVIKAQGETTGPAGGYLVPTMIENEILEYRALSGIARQEARIRPMGSDMLNAPLRTGGVTAYFVGESSQITESQATWGSIDLAAKKLAALTRISSELVEDAAADLGMWFVEEMASSFADLEDGCMFNGDGTAAYGGMTGIRTALIDANHGAGKVAAANGHNTFATLDAGDVAALMAALPERYWQTAKFHTSGYGAANAFARLGATAGGTIMTIAGPRPMLHYLGFPIVITPKYPGAGDQTGKIMLTFGDLSQAVELGDRRGVTVDASRNRYLEFDQVAIRGTERFAITAANLGDNSNAGPVVGLVGA
jgi:HK97 family phage major capsid protein